MHGVLREIANSERLCDHLDLRALFVLLALFALLVLLALRVCLALLAFVLLALLALVALFALLALLALIALRALIALFALLLVACSAGTCVNWIRLNEHQFMRTPSPRKTDEHR